MSDLLPPPIKLHLADLTDDPKLERTWHGRVFRALCYMAGLGVEQKLNEGKKLIDEATFDCANSSIFQTMFLPRERSHRSQDDIPQAQLMNLMLLFAEMTTGSHEATQKLIQYFPIEGGHASRRCRHYRKWKYCIQSPPATQELGSLALIAQEADIEVQFSQNFHLFPRIKHSRLHFSVAMGYFEATQAILNSLGVDRSLLGLRDYKGDTPFLLAMRFGLFDITQLLISAGSDVNAQNLYGETAFHFLVEFDIPSEREKMAHSLFKHCKRSLSESSSESSFPKEGVTLLSEGDGTPLNRIVLRNNIPLAKTFMKYRVSPATKGKWHALQLAAEWHSYDMLQIFWEAFPGLPAWSEDDMLAAACLTFRPRRMYVHGTQTDDNTIKSLNFLINRRQASRAGPLFVRGVPLLHWALSRSIDKEIRLYLVSRSTKDEIDTYCPSGDLSVTAVHIAIQSGSAEILEAVLDKGGNAFLPMKNERSGDSIESITACCGNPSTNNRMLKRFLDAHKEKSVPLPTTALVMSVLNNNFSAAAMLIKARVDINAVDEKGTTPLGNVIKRCTVDSLEQIKFLLEYPPLVGRPAAGFVTQPKIGSTALHLLAVIPSATPVYNREALHSITDYLLYTYSSPPQINWQTNESGYTALHLSASSNYIVASHLLEKPGININLKGYKSKKTAQELNQEYLVGSVPPEVSKLGESAVKRYEDDVLKVRNLFASDSDQWESVEKLEQIPLKGGKIAHRVRVKKRPDKVKEEEGKAF
jgi:ankyrin repeat protein